MIEVLLFLLFMESPFKVGEERVSPDFLDIILFHPLSGHRNEKSGQLPGILHVDPVALVGHQIL